MKDLMRKGLAFMVFDSPLQTDKIRNRFEQAHQKRQAETNGWSTNATRQLLIADYWSGQVALHFSLVLGIPVLVFFLIGHGFSQPVFFLGTTLLAGSISYFVLYYFYYNPTFHSTFLPRLEAVKESYELKQAGQLEKCRQLQLSNFSLTLFYYVLTETNQLSPLCCDDHCANLLTKLYGVDQGSMKKNLELILGTVKRKNLTERKITELKNRFSETYDFMQSIQFTAGIEKLKELEGKFFFC